MRVDQPRQQRLLAQIDELVLITRPNLGKASNIDDRLPSVATAPFSMGAPSIVTTTPRANNHSPFTTFRHLATSKLQASWQSNGIIALG